MSSHPDWQPWELEMLRCDRNRSERGAILWFSDALQMDLRLCLHHSKIHAVKLKDDGFDRLTPADEVVAL